MIAHLLAVCIAASAVFASYASAQDDPSLQWRPAPSTGRDLKPEAQAIIDASNAQAAFEAVSDTRFRLVRHRASGITCTFLMGTEARLIVREGVANSAACVDVQSSSIRRFDLLHNPDATVDEIFENVVRSERGAPFWREHYSETRQTRFLANSPVPPFAALPYPRRGTTLLGRTSEGPAMVRVTIAETPNDWFIAHTYSVFFPEADRAQVEAWGIQGTELSEQGFAARLGELTAPIVDPALQAERPTGR